METLFDLAQPHSGVVAHLCEPIHATGVRSLLQSTDNRQSEPTGDNKVVGFVCLDSLNGLEHLLGNNSVPPRKCHQPVRYIWIYPSAAIAANEHGLYTVTETRANGAIFYLVRVLYSIHAPYVETLGTSAKTRLHHYHNYYHRLPAITSNTVLPRGCDGQIFFSAASGDKVLSYTLTTLAALSDVTHYAVVAVQKQQSGYDMALSTIVSTATAIQSAVDCCEDDGAYVLRLFQLAAWLKYDLDTRVFIGLLFGANFQTSAIVGLADMCRERNLLFTAHGTVLSSYHSSAG